MISLKNESGYPLKRENLSIKRIIMSQISAEDNVQPHKTNEITTRNGRALLIVQTKASVGDATINVSADGLKGTELGLNIEAISVLNSKP